MNILFINFLNFRGCVSCAGKRTGIVVTSRVTHATPAAGYAHSAERDWENDAAMLSEDNLISPSLNAPFNCSDIARQLVEDNYDMNVS